MQTRMEKQRKIKKRRSLLLQNILSGVLLLALFTGGVVGYSGSKLGSFLNEVGSDDTEIDIAKATEVTKDLKELKPFAALILGIDIDLAGTSRSDTIILASVNPAEESMQLLSIPRDTLITLPNGQIEKINAAYTMGGPRLTMQLIEQRFQLPIDFYATMEFNGLVDLVNAVGGITVDSEFAFTEKSHINRNHIIQITEGEQRLDGTEALGYARMRKQDPRGDFGRQDRQKEVIEQILYELVSFRTFTNLTGIMDAIQPYLKTNATSSQMLEIAGSYHPVMQNVNHLALDGEAGSAYFPHYGLNVYIWEPYPESVERVAEQFRVHLELEELSGNATEDLLEIKPIEPSID